jgi:hypothetical protein
MTEPFVGEADRAARAAPVLDALIALEALDIDLESDGATVWFAGDGWRRVPPDLRAVVQQCSHRLAGLLGDAQRWQAEACCVEG